MADIRDRLSRRYNRERMKKQLNYRREFNDSNFTLRVTVPTLSYDTLDCPGETILPWRVMKVLDSGQFISYFRTGKVDFEDTEQTELVTYLMYQQLEIDLSFYDIDTPKFPLLLEHKCRYLKRTSRSTIASLRHPSRVKPYAMMEYIGVRIDPVTRKPIPFPEWWKTRYGISSEGSRTEHIIPKTCESTKLLSTEQKVVYSDVDANGHANYTFYPRISYESFAECLFSGQLNNDAEQYFRNGVKKIQTSFYKECTMGDILKVEIWQDDNSSDTFYFNIKKNEELLANLTITFHKQSAAISANKL